MPLNDPEDQATYFVDLPDFAANVTDIQVQRGVGNSLYGDASFGGSVNIVTNVFAREKQVDLLPVTANTGAESDGETSPNRRGVYLRAGRRPVELSRKVLPAEERRLPARQLV